MSLSTQEMAIISNEKLVQIAFGIVLDRIRRKAPKQSIRLMNTKRLHLSHNLSTMRCVRTFSYQCNESDTPTSRTPSSRRVSSTDNSSDNKPEHEGQRPSKPKPLSHKPQQLSEPAKVPVAAAGERQQKDVSTSVTPHEQAGGGDWGRYYMRTDTRSRDTVLACHNSVNSSRSAETAHSRKHHHNRKLAPKTRRIPDKRSSGSTSTSSGSGMGSVNGSGNAREESGKNRAHTFRVKIDQEQLGRALGSLSASELPTELLVDVNCSPSCRVSGVSIRQNRSIKQCVLSLKVDSGNGGAATLPSAAPSPNPQQTVSYCEEQVVKVVEADKDSNTAAAAAAKSKKVPVDNVVMRFGDVSDAQVMPIVAST